MKNLIFTLTLALLTLGAFAIQPAYAHCGKCGDHMKSEKMQPCEKTMKDGKPCEKCMEKMEHNHSKMHVVGEKEPCEICAKSEIADPISPTSIVETTTTSSNVTIIESIDRSNIGSLHMLSGNTNSKEYND